jgi:hypothetical protein
MSVSGQIRKSSWLTPDFRLTPESGHPVGGLGCPKSARKRHRVPFRKRAEMRLDRRAIGGHRATQIVFDPGLSTQSSFGPDSPDFRFFLSTEYGV